MKIHHKHDFKLTSIKHFQEVQKNLVNEIRLVNNFNSEGIQYCAGVDLAYWTENEVQFGVCSIVVIDFISKQVVEEVYSSGKITTPYMAGFLAFRELPLVIKAAEKLKLTPDIFLFDGNGYLHFSHMGIATHASLFLHKPCIGVAKSYLKINNVDFNMPKDVPGDFTDIIIDNEIYGRALRTKAHVKPIFISCGNFIDLATSTEIVLKLIGSDSKLPIPVRLADLNTHKLRTELQAK